MDELHVRIVGLGNEGYAERLDWLLSWLSTTDIYRYRYGDWSYLLQSSRLTDIYILHGEDLTRMVRLVREIRSVLPSKAIICLYCTGGGGERAALLMAGADDVITRQCAKKEAAARVRAHTRRMQIRKAVSLKHERACGPSHADALSAIKLTYRETLMLQALISHSPVGISYDDLLDVVGGGRGVAKMNALRVAVSILRKKVARLLDIRSRSGFGYFIEKKTV
ncbi:winged helix-turn-helix domain-containing protein [Novosphingobium jiangmenense]|uniref:Response regulator transcription factor n=1 Tax=Novosphingobium jiangmenense TaxID=2791981 RepID=A0ABS0HIS6_9SPHN|nr:winged helix-turn-helix domain-containing protein [Novosphingobium jiangmenense]MBF9152162.1 response regulator transcription factor [Novosphingobium jiangmenense]